MGTSSIALLVFGILAVNVSAFHEICAGCPVNHDPSSFSMDKLSKALATAQVNDGVTKIISVTSQVVSGVKYTVVYESASGKTCTATWVEMPWAADGPVGTKITCEPQESSVDLENSNMIFGALLKAHQMRKRSLSSSDLSPQTVDLLKKHLGYLMDDRTNSLYTQEVTKINITRVDRLLHGYKVEASAELRFTNCTKGNPSENCQLTKNGQVCDVTMKMIQPQGGYKRYELDAFKCRGR